MSEKINTFRLGQKIVAKRFWRNKRLNDHTGTIKEITITGGMYIHWKDKFLNNGVDDNTPWVQEVFDLVIDTDLKCRKT
jgi:hypothetical protein